MTSKRPTPLKDEPVTQLDELQELLAANLEAMEALNRNLCGHSDMKPVDTEALEKRIATVARNAVKELLEERQRGFEREEEEDRAQGKLTPQECYVKLAADYADVLEKCIIVCDTYKYIGEATKRQEARSREVEAKLDVLIDKQEVRAADVKKTAFPPRPKQFKDIPLYCLRWMYHSRGVRRFLWICLFFIWLISVATACFIAYDNAVMRKEIQNSQPFR